MNKSTVRKTDIRVVKTFDKLYFAFFEMLKETPYESISILELCEKASVHRATFYKHFIDKHDFLCFCCNRLLENLDLTSDTTYLGEGEEGKTSYMTLCKRVIDYVYDNKTMISGLLASPGSFALVDAFILSFTDIFEKRLNRIVANGGYIASPIPMLSNFYAGAIVSLIKWWISAEEKYTKDDMLRFILLRFNEVEISFLRNKNNKDIC